MLPAAALALAAALAAAGRPPLASRVSVTLDLGGPTTPFPHYWTRSFGSGHALMGTRADWQTHLRLAVDELGLQGVRMQCVHPCLPPCSRGPPWI